jgi:hypothetical protein
MAQRLGEGAQDPYEHDYHNQVEDACPWHPDGNCWVTECQSCGDKDNPELLSHHDVAPSGKERKIAIHGNPDFHPDNPVFDHLQGERWEPYDETKLSEHNLNKQQFNDIIKNLDVDTDKK